MSPKLPAKTPKAPKIIYAVFFDTNAIKGKYWIDHTVRENAGIIGKDSLITIHLFLPEVVQREWSRYYLRHAKEHYDKIINARKALADMNFTALSPEQFNATEVEEQSKSFLASLGFTFVPTPHDNIDYPALLDLAISHEPPFEPKDGTDKGLKDAVIAQTIKNYASDHPDQKVIVVGADGLMTTYLQTIMPKDGSFTRYSSIEEFSGDLKLENSDLSKELTHKASEAFFIQDVKDTFYYRLSIRDTLLGKYRSKLIDADAAKKHLEKIEINDETITEKSVRDGQWTIGANIILVGDPTFYEKKGDKLFWGVDLDFVQDYSVQLADQESQSASTSCTVKHTVRFKVSWSAELSHNGELKNPTLVAINEVGESQAVQRPQLSATLRRLLGLESSPILSLTNNASLTAAQALVDATKRMPDMSWINSIPSMPAALNSVTLPAIPPLPTIHIPKISPIPDIFPQSDTD